MRRLLKSVVLTATLASSPLLSGCQMFEYLRPHNMWKLNRHPPVGGEDGYFSVPAARFEAEVSAEAASFPGVGVTPAGGRE